ncbi:hypothetical protein ACFQL4_20760 [Halosimplex aquaticum]
MYSASAWASSAFQHRADRFVGRHGHRQQAVAGGVDPGQFLDSVGEFVRCRHR